MNYKSLVLIAFYQHLRYNVSGSCWWCHEGTRITSISMCVSAKDSPNISGDMGVTKGLASHLSRCGCHKRTHVRSLSECVSAKDSPNISGDVGVTKGLASHLSRCRCHEKTHITSLSMWV